MNETSETWPHSVRNPDAIRLLVRFDAPHAGLLGYTIAVTSAFDAAQRARKMAESAPYVAFGLEAQYDDVTVLHHVEGAEDVFKRYLDIATASEQAKLIWAKVTA